MGQSGLTAIPRLLAGQALDAKRQTSLLRADIDTPSIRATFGFMKLSESGVDAMAVEAMPPYDVTDQHIPYGCAVPGSRV